MFCIFYISGILHKGNDKPFENNFLWLEGSIPYICLFFRDLVVARLQINLTEVFGPRELIKEVVDSGTSFLLWFYSEPSNQYRVTRFHLSFVSARLGSRKVMRWDGCAPCGAVLGSVARCPHSLIESGDRLAHWAAVHQRSDRWGAWPGSAEVPL